MTHLLARTCCLAQKSRRHLSGATLAIAYLAQTLLYLGAGAAVTKPRCLAHGTKGYVHNAE